MNAELPRTDAPRRHPADLPDALALRLVRLLRVLADTFFAKRYGHRAIVLETVAAVPGMIGGALQHLRCLRLMRDDRGWIATLLDEAENERMHLMTFVQLEQPTWLERMLVLFVQGVFFNAFFLLYLLAPRVAHRFVGYLEEEAVESYTRFLEEIDAGRHANVPAPASAIAYWNLPPDARLRELVVAIRADEANHRDVNHGFADDLVAGGHRDMGQSGPARQPAGE
jgi:ubiquinol oxidase